MSAFPRIVHLVQILLLHCSYGFFRLILRGRRGTISWVVGPDEIASMVRHIASAIPHSYSVSFSTHPFYDFRYDASSSMAAGSRMRSIERILRGPVLLAHLAVAAKGFVYVGATGFLIDQVDGRAHEFAFLKKHNLRICCFFVGDDVRSPRLMHELERVSKNENISSYAGLVNPAMDSDAYDAAKRSIAASADEFSDMIVSSTIDQSSYLTRPTIPFMYFYPDDRFLDSTTKFDEIDRVRIVHAPSSPLIKGTPLVRAAISRLRHEGYVFDYDELHDVPNEQVLAKLAETHVVLNQFYAFLPGVFGIEAMAARCAVLTSADEFVETDLPAGSNQAWFVTRSYEIYDHLRLLLDKPERIQEIATRGHAWAKMNASESSNASKLIHLLGML